MATTILSLLTPLLPSDPAVSSLLTAHRPLAYPSHLAHGDTHKFLNKLSSFVSVPVAVSSSRSTPASQEFVLTRSESDEWDKRNDACALVIKIIKMDKEGYVLGAGWGKTWLLNLLAALSVSQSSSLCIPAYSTDMFLRCTEPKCTHVVSAQHYYSGSVAPHAFSPFAKLSTSHIAPQPSQNVSSCSQHP